MDDAPPPKQFFIRNEKGKRWGPMLASTLEVIVPQGLFGKRLQASEDGESFAMIGRFPELREVLGEEWWGMDPGSVPPPPADDGAVSLDAIGTPVASDDGAVSLDAIGTPVASDDGAVSLDAIGTPVAAADDAVSLDAIGVAVTPPPPTEAPPVEVEVPERGDLDDTPVLRLAYLLAADKASARLTLKTDSRSWEVFYKKGSPEHVSWDGQALGAWLVEQGHLDDARLAQAEQAKAGFGGSFVGALLGLGLIDPGTGFQHLGRWATEVYLEALLSSSGRFEVERDAPMPADSFPLGASPFEHLVAAARKLQRVEVEARLGARMDAPAMKSNASAVSIEDLRLGPQEARLYPAFDGVHSIRDLADGEGGDRAVALAYLLVQCDFLSFAEMEAPRTSPDDGGAEDDDYDPDEQTDPGMEVPDAVREVESPPTSAPAPAAPAPAATEPAEADSTDWKAEGARLAKLRDRWESADHFVVLGLRRECSGDEVKAAFNKQVRVYHPDRAIGAPDEVKETLQDLFARITGAYKELSSDSRRRGYANELAAAELASQQSEDPGALDDVKARVASEDIVGARRAVDALLADHPESASGWAWSAWITILEAPNPKAAKRDAIQRMTRALKLDPRCGEAYLCATRIAMAMGDAANASRYLKKARALGVKDEP